MLSRLWKPLLLGATGVGATSLWMRKEAGRFPFEPSSLSAEGPVGLPEPADLTIPTRNEQLTRLREAGKEWDVLVIGGGATGSGVALDAASRGLSVALVEKDDFSSGLLHLRPLSCLSSHARCKISRADRNKQERAARAQS